MHYSHRWTILNQPILQSRRFRSELICLFKILNNFSDVNLKSFFNVLPIIISCTHNLRGNAFKLDIPKPRPDRLKFSYVYRVIKCWNGLPTFDCDTPSIAIFKKRLSEYMIGHLIWFIFCFCLCTGIIALVYGLSGLHTFVLFCYFIC